MSGARAASISFSTLLIALLLRCSAGSADGDPSLGAGGGDTCPNDLPNRQACADGVPNYAFEVAPIIEDRCAVCHYAGNTQSAVVLTDYAGVFARRRTLQSRVYACVMPPDSAPPLTASERAILLEWLVCDAPGE